MGKRAAAKSFGERGRSIGPTFALGIHLWRCCADITAMALWRRIPRAQRTSERKTLRERGAAAVEFALVAPLFFLVVFGGIEFGLLARSQLTLQDATRSATRIASIQRDDMNADRAILKQIVNRADNLNGEIERVVIFAPDTLVDEVPASCTGPGAGSSAGVCTVYEANELADTADGTTPPKITGLMPSQRTSLEPIGVYIEYRYQFVTGFFDTRILRSTSVEAVELSI